MVENIWYKMYFVENQSRRKAAAPMVHGKLGQASTDSSGLSLQLCDEL